MRELAEKFRIWKRFGVGRWRGKKEGDVKVFICREQEFFFFFLKTRRRGSKMEDKELE